MKIPLNENRVEWGTLKSYDNVELSREDDYVGHPPAQEGQRAAKFPAAQNYAACLSAVVEASDGK